MHLERDVQSALFNGRNGITEQIALFNLSEEKYKIEVNKLCYTNICNEILLALLCLSYHSFIYV